MRKIWENKLIRFLISGAIAALLILKLPGCLFGVQYYAFVITIIILFLLVNLAPVIGRYAWFTYGARILVGGLFIFSGAIKANDPLGFSYKLEEYFEIFGKGFPCNMGSQELPEGKALSELTAEEQGTGSHLKPMYDFFAEHSLALAIIICIFEIMLGGMILLGYRVNLSLWLSLLMIIFFSFLTFYSACCNQVKTCGCFGDFIQLTPWESFWKDLILLVLLAFLFVGKNNIHPPFKPLLNAVLLLVIILFAVWLPWYTYNYLPIFDFRPYKPGTDMCKDRINIPDEMKWYYTYKKDGVEKEFEQAPDSTWEYVSYRNEVIKPGVPAKIVDFSINTTEGVDVTDSVLNAQGYKLFLVTYDINSADRDEQAQINELYAHAKQDGTPFIALTGSVENDISKFKAATKAQYPFYNTDGTALKTMVRANPGLVLLKGCEVIEMWHNNSLPSYSEVKEKYMK